MRLQDDEIEVLRFFAGGSTFSAGRSRSKTILKKLQYHGLVDANEELTKRGRHVVSKLPPLSKPEQEQNGNLQGSNRARVDSQSGPGDSGRDQAEASDRDREPAERSDVAAAYRPDAAGSGDAHYLPRPDSETGIDSGTVRETTAISTRCDAYGD